MFSFILASMQLIIFIVRDLELTMEDPQTPRLLAWLFAMEKDKCLEKSKP